MVRADERAGGSVGLLGVVPWVVLAACAVAVAVLHGADRQTQDGALVVALSALFVSLVVALLVAVRRVPRRRRPALLALVVGVVLWAAGSVWLSSTEIMSVQSFPTSGEGFFAASYVGLAAFVLLDGTRGAQPPATVWLDAVVICGGVTCVLAAVLVLPLSAALDRTGLALLLALLYPLLDLALVALVLGQAVAGGRAPGWSTVLPAAGFLVLAVADSSFLLVDGNGAYPSASWLNLLWGASFTLVVTGAVRRRRRAVTAPAERATGLLVAASLAAVVVLVVRPEGGAQVYVTVPAALTLGAAGFRMSAALRQARATAEAVRLSLTDELTGLANRRAVLAAMARRLADTAPLALLMVDLDGFKEINDSLGHLAGDTVLRAVGDRLTGAVGPGVTVSRLGGDEFALLVPEHDPLDLLELARDVREVLLRPLPVDDLRLGIRCSIGIAVADVEHRSSEDLLRQADVAMYEAKQAASGIVVYDATRDGFSRQRLLLAEELRGGIVGGQLELWYQPQVQARTRTVVAVEALVRWAHPVHGLLQPAEFLPGARRSGLMPALTEAVVAQAVRDLARWRSQGETFRVAINVAPTELLGGSLLPLLYGQLERAGLEASALVVEVTEDSFLSDPERARRVVRELHEHDVDVSVDDYGTGFSSLAHLRDLPVQEMKIDRSFVSTVSTDHRSRVIVQSSTQMGHAMDMRVVAEGVEDADTAAMLAGMGVDLLQGFHVCPPLPAHEVSGWVAAHSGAAAPVVHRAPRIVR